MMVARKVARLLLYCFCSLVAAEAFAAAPLNAAQTTATNIEPIVQVNFDDLDAKEIAGLLGWVRNPNEENSCHGHYLEPDDIMAHPKAPGKNAPISVSAHKPAFFSQYGTSVIQGDVSLIQPGREVTAERVTFFRDEKTGKISESALFGNVHLRESGKLIVANQGHLDFANDEHTIEDAIYRFLANTPTGITNIWGRAKHALRDAAGVLKFRHATYSTCPPDATVWHIWSSSLTLNRNTGRGDATNALFYVKSVPLFYLPYFNFPISKERKSGFLYPGASFSQDSGFGLGIPYYFNLAPNYDALVTPQFFSKRGVLLNGQYRYLTPADLGQLNLSFIPYDDAFAKFRNSAATVYPHDHALDILKNSDLHRSFVNFSDAKIFDDHWRGSLNINHVSDDYFMQDFGTTAQVIDNDQLLNQADLEYLSDHWHFLSRAQVFQTLHPVNQAATQDQYRRLPQLDLNGNYPDGYGGLNYQLNTEFVNFLHRDDFYTGAPVIAGVRTNFQPKISLPINWLGGYIKPETQLQVTSYSLHDNHVRDPFNNITRVVPIFSFDSGMFFSREIKLFNNALTQTLEPRLFYLYVPKNGQDSLPIFDTFLPTLDLDQMFRVNRFSGIDRVGDANQVTTGVVSRFLDAAGQEKLNLGLGEIFQFRRHEVCLDATCSGDPMIDNNISPLVGHLQYYINSQWNTAADVAWDPNQYKFNSGTATLQYRREAQQLINFSYNYLQHGDPSNTNVSPVVMDLHRVGFAMTWSLGHNWNVIGNWDYNISYHRTQNYFYGLEYESCCWALRAVKDRSFISVGTNNQNNYHSAIYVQFLLKGLGHFDVSDAGSLLTSRINGYQDKFATGSTL